MKKFIFMTLALFMLVMSASAQTAIETSRFTDNTSITLQGGIVTPFNHFFKDGSATPTIVLGVDKFVTPWLGFGIDGRTTIGTGSQWNPHTAFDQVNVSGYVKLNLRNAFSYTGTKHVFEPILYTGIGWGHSTCSAPVSLSQNYAHQSATINVNGRVASIGLPTEDFGWIRNYMTYRAGCEFNFNLGQKKAWALVVNPSVVWGNIDNGRLCKANGNFELTAGVKYNFLNANGTRTFKVWDVGSLNAQINSLIAENESLKHIKPTIVEKTTIKEKTINLTTVVPFELNSSVLTAAAKAILNKIPSNSVVSIVGAASPEGESGRNSVLSQERAKVTSEYLSSRGVKVLSAKGDEAGRVAIVTIED